MSGQALSVYPYPDGKWAVAAKPQGRAILLLRTQTLAVDAARERLRPGGGTILVHGRDGSLKRRVGVPATLAAAAADAARIPEAEGHARRARDDEPLTLEDAVDGVHAADARLHGHAYDKDGDGEPDGEDILDRALTVGPPTPASAAMPVARLVVDWGLLAASLLTLVGVGVVAPGVGGGVVGVFLSTLPFSFAAAIITARVVYDRRTLNGWGWFGWIVGAVLASNLITGVINQATITALIAQYAEGPVRLPTVPPKYLVVALGGGIVTWALGTAVATYGPLGAALSALCGAMVGWRGMELFKHYAG